MIAAALLLAGVAGGAAMPPPEQAAGLALMQCVAHATGQGAITAANRAAMAANGLNFLDAPPPLLASTARTAFGTASFAEAPSQTGNVWTVGYDRGACLVFAVGMPVAAVESRLVALFDIPNSFVKRPPAPAAPGERKLEYAWAVRPGLDLSALVSLREPAPGKGFVMVTINRVLADK